MTGSPSPVIDLLLRLVGIDSTNPLLSPGGAGEGGVARFLAEHLARAGFEIDTWDVRPSRPNLVARLPGYGGGRSLIVCGHTDVVGAEPEAFVPRLENGRVHGRGALDMKAGIAAAVIAAERVAKAGRLAGDVLLAFCVDEEWRSEGAESLVERYHADGAILPEPSGLDVVTSHGGFVWYDVVSEGVEAAGGDPERGVDSIALVGPVLTAIAELDRSLAARVSELWGRGSVHASTIGGGTTYPSYPPTCRVTIERCLIPGESVATADAEVAAMLEAATQTDPRFRGGWERIVGRDPVVLDPGEPIATTLCEAAGLELGRAVEPRFDIGWMDSGVLSDAGIPCAVFGPSGNGEHTPDEWVDADSVEVCARVLERAIHSFCD